MPAAPFEVATAFVAAINAGDRPALRALMTEDHTFTDALGTRLSGADKMAAGWEYFLHAYPEYWIRVDHILAVGNHVALFGRAGGKWRRDDQVLPGSWSVAAAWLAEIEAGRVRRWSVFCDTGWVTAPGDAEEQK